MEETRLPNLDQQSRSGHHQSVQWYWQSGVAPWRAKDNDKLTWEVYEDNISRLIEENYLRDPQGIVDIGNYEIDLKRLKQVNKKDKDRVRRIKREIISIRQSRFLIDLPRPSIIEKNQKTINHAFGNVQHFLDYIMKRTPEAYKLFHRLKELSLDCKHNEYKDIVEEVIICIKKGAETREKVIQIRPDTPTASFIYQANHVVYDITDQINEKLTLRDFLRLILRIYTMESFICYWLNELLRSENWEEINVMTPYLVCLTYAFQIKDYVIKPEEPKRLVKSFLSLFKKRGVLLYRGAALVKTYLNYYHPGTTRYFSWNGVTSTSRSREQAVNFVGYSLKKNNPGETLGVLFTIKSDLETAEDCEGMIDVSRESKFPDEQEVILAPGTVFEVKDFQFNKTENFYEVRLKIRKKFKKNPALLGALQSKVISGDKVIFSSLPSEEIMKALQLLEGNQLVKKLEIVNCSLDLHLIELIMTTVITTNIKEENTMMVGNVITIDNLSIFYHYFPSKDLNIVNRDNIIVFKEEPNAAPNGFPESWRLKNLSLERKTLETFSQKSQLNRLTRHIKIETQLISLNLSIGNLPILKNDLINIVSSVESLTSLKTLWLDFESNTSMCDQILDVLQKAVKKSTSLGSIFLNIMSCTSVSEKGIHSLGEIADLPISLQLTIFSKRAWLKGLAHDELAKSIQQLQGKAGAVKCLQIKNCIVDSPLLELLEKMGISKNINQDDILLIQNQIVVESLCALCDHFTPKNLNKVCRENKIELHSDIPRQQQVKKEKVRNTSLFLERETIEAFYRKAQLEELSQMIKHETHLTSLHLEIKDLPLSDNSLVTLISPIDSLTSLRSLTLDFETSKSVYDQGIDHLKKCLMRTTSLKHLALNFNSCKTISHRALSYLIEALESLPALQHLYLSFVYCREDLLDNKLEDFGQVLTRLTSLKSLDLNFKFGTSITDQVIDNLKTGLRTLTSLERLGLDFESCKNISNHGLSNLKDALVLLKSLKQFTLSLKFCCNISDQGLEYLKDGLESLTELEHLSLDFETCTNISDKGLDKLTDPLKSLSKLQLLSLNFEGCTNISNNGFSELGDNFKMLIRLRHLSLDFEWCENIEDDGIIHLKEALQTLTSLEHLSINFGGCNQLSDTGLYHLKEGLSSLTELQHLSLNFEWCQDITDKSIHSLKDVLLVLSSLRHLSLNFDRCRRISSNGMEHLKAGLQSVKTLEHLSLGFGKCSEILDKGFEHLKEAFQFLISLKHLSLNFDSCNNLSDQALEDLKEGLKPLSSLQHLSLNFSDCTRFSDDSLTSLKDSLKSLTTLQHLSFNFCNCNKISDEGMTNLGEGLQSLASLQNLSLDFSKCSDISDLSLSNLKDALQILISLQNLSLHFDHCKKVTRQGSETLENVINALPSVASSFIGVEH